MAVPPYILDNCPCCDTQNLGGCPAEVPGGPCSSCTTSGNLKWRFFAEQVQCVRDAKNAGIVFSFRVGAQSNCGSIPPITISNSSASNELDWYKVLGIGNVKYGSNTIPGGCTPNPNIKKIRHLASGTEISTSYLQPQTELWVQEPFEEYSVRGIDSPVVSQYTGIVHPVEPTIKQTGIGYYQIEVRISKLGLDSVGFKWGDELVFEWSINCRHFLCNKDKSIDAQANTFYGDMCGGEWIMPYPFADFSTLMVNGVITLNPTTFDPVTNELSNFHLEECCSIGVSTVVNTCPGYEWDPTYDCALEVSDTDIFLGKGDGDTCKNNDWCLGDIDQRYRLFEHSYIGKTQSIVLANTDLSVIFDTNTQDSVTSFANDQHQILPGVPYFYTYKVLNKSLWNWNGTANKLKVELIQDNTTPTPSKFDVVEIKGFDTGNVPITVVNNVYSTGWIVPLNTLSDPAGDLVEIKLEIIAQQDFKGTLRIFIDPSCDPGDLNGGFYSPLGHSLVPQVLCSETDAYQRTNQSNCFNAGVNLEFSSTAPTVCDCDDIEVETLGQSFNWLNTDLDTKQSQRIELTCNSNDCDNFYFDVIGECVQFPSGVMYYFKDENDNTVPTPQFVTVIQPSAALVDCNELAINPIEWIIEFEPGAIVDMTNWTIVIGYTIGGTCCVKSFPFNASSACVFDCFEADQISWYANDAKGKYVKQLSLKEWDVVVDEKNPCVCKLDDKIYPIHMPSGQVFQAYRQLTFMNPDPLKDVVIEISRTANCLGVDAFWLDFGPTVILPNPIAVDAPFDVEGTTVHTYGTIKITPGAIVYVNLYFNSMQLFNAGIDVACGPSSGTGEFGESLEGGVLVHNELCQAIGCKFEVKLHKTCPVISEATGLPEDVWTEKCQQSFTPLIGLECCDCPPNCPCEDGVNATIVELENQDPNTEVPLWEDLFNAGVSCCPPPIGNYCFVDNVDFLLFNLIKDAESESKFNWNANGYNIVNDIFYLYLLLGILDWERFLQTESIINSGVFDETDPCTWELPTTLPILDAAGLNCLSADEKKSCICNYFQCKGIDISPLLDCKGMFTNLTLTPNQYEILGIEEPLSGINYMCIEECIPSTELCPTTQFVFIVK